MTKRRPASSPGSDSDLGLGLDLDPESELSEVDQRILQLNHEDHSMRQISRLLKERYDITLGRSSVIRHLTELRQDPDNEVQVNNECTVPLIPREETKWYNVISRLKEAIADYTRMHDGRKPSFRTMQYQLIDEKVISSTVSDHKSLGEATVKARLGWVDSNDKLLYPKLDIDCFADDESRLVYYGYSSYSPTEPTEPGPIEHPMDYIGKYIRYLKSCVISYDGVGTPGERGNIGGRWYDQPEYVEVWEEKNDLFPEFKNILGDKKVTIRANHGYPSLIFLYLCTKELKELIDSTGIEPENIHIKYCGDWDPSGENIDWYIKKRFKQLGIEGIDFQKVAVRLEQIEEYNLPLSSIDKKPGKKAADPNMSEFVRRHGKKATHLNAFFTEKHFNTFKIILRNAVDEHWDEDIYDAMVEEYDIEPEEPDKMDDDELEEVRNEMCKEIINGFKPGWTKGYPPKYGITVEYGDDDEE